MNLSTGIFDNEDASETVSMILWIFVSFDQFNRDWDLYVLLLMRLVKVRGDVAGRIVSKGNFISSRITYVLNLARSKGVPSSR